MDANPYQPPVAEIPASGAASAKRVYPASKGQRFATFIIDYILTLVLGSVLVAVVLLTSGEAALEGIPDMLLGVLMMLLYYVPLEGLMGRTPGKWITGTRVVSADDRDVTFGRVVLRSLCRFVPFEAFSGLSDGPMWHDSWSKTRVVTTRPPKYLQDDL